MTQAFSMGVKRTALFFLPLLLVGRYAYADNTGLVVPPPSTGQNAPSRPISQIDYLSNRFLVIKERSVIADPTFRNEVVNAKSENVSSIGSPSTGLHVRTDDQHLGLEYRSSNDGTIRVHVGRHGASVASGWSF